MLTAKEIAQMLKMSYRHVAERVTKRKDFPRPYRVGRMRLWNQDEVFSWLEQRRV